MVKVEESLFSVEVVIAWDRLKDIELKIKTDMIVPEWPENPYNSQEIEIHLLHG
jgi:hypothetical protein